MGFKNIFSTSSNNILERNMELLEENDLVNIFGSPNKLFLKFMESKNLDITVDEITEELLDEFESSLDSINLKQTKIQKEKQHIFKQRKVWINILEDDELVGTDLILDFDGITVDKTNQKILYCEMKQIGISEGGWSKNRFVIETGDGELVFEINENRAIPLKEIIEDNIENQTHDELDDLLDLYGLYEEGKISSEEFEARKAIIYSDERYCTNCGFKLDSDSLFCPECGHEVSN